MLLKILAILMSILAYLIFAGCGNKADEGIDRRALVQRHIPVLNAIDSLSPFSVGNGEFAFTADITGLQTFPGFYEDYIPLGTQSHWDWHSAPHVQVSLKQRLMPS